jgi:X-X-X-Leu-X-X-Gly heptad repeat protein
MNRSILIVICDFLLVSLLAFSTVDINKVSQNGAPRQIKTEIATNQVTAHQDLGDVMRLALQEERKSREAVLAELNQTRQSVTERDQQLQNFQSRLQSKDQQAAHLQEQETNLAHEVALAQSNIAVLNQQLQASTEESLLSQAQRDLVEAEARKQLEKATALEHQLSDLQQSNQFMQAERSSLSNQLQVTEAAHRAALSQMTQLQGEVEAQRQVNAKLADGVQTLAAKSSELAQEIRENRALGPNEIFQQLITNRLMASFYGLKSGLFGTDTKYKQSQIVLATDGTNTFALCHLQDTPLTLWTPGTQWEELSGTIAFNNSVLPVDSVSFSSADPRALLIPVPAAQARALGCRIYQLARDPFRFQDAVVAGTRENYYGVCKFQIDMETPRYVKMDRSTLRGLFGKFNPSSGDLVFTQSGELLGLMVNNSYCLVLRSFDPGVTLRFGPQGHNQPTAQTLSSLYAVVSQLPYKLQ